MLGTAVGKGWAGAEGPLCKAGRTGVPRSAVGEPLRLAYDLHRDSALTPADTLALLHSALEDHTRSALSA